MDVLNLLLSAGGGNAIRQLSRNFGLSEDQTTSAVSNMLPALGAGLARNAAQPGGLDALLGALSSRKHEGYLDNPEALSSGDAIADGNGILGHILGSKDVSRGIARKAAAQTGIGEDVLKKMLPAVAGLAMGMLSKQNPEGAISNLRGPASQSGGVMGILGSFLDADKDGSVLDDVMGMAGKIFNK
jgi:hypothetical protein